MRYINLLLTLTSEPLFNAWFLGPTQILNPNGISIGSAIFSQFVLNVLILYNELPLFPSELPIPVMDLHPHLIHGCLGPPDSSAQTVS